MTNTKIDTETAQLETALKEPTIPDVARNARRLDLNGSRSTGYEWEEHRLDMTHLLTAGIEPATVSEDGILFEGMAHHVYAKAEQGKTWLAMWFAVRAMYRDETVLYLDQENGSEIVAERLQAFEVTDADAFNYFEYLPMNASRDAVANYAGMLDNIEPDLIIFDSWAGFLSLCDFDEDSNTDIERWGRYYLTPARQRRITTVILDHVPHNATRPRGASRKTDMVDVGWKLSLRGDIDSVSPATMTLKREKSRRKGLEEAVTFSVGEAPDGFTFKRTGEAAPDTATTGPDEDDARALEALRGFGGNGAKAQQWRDSIKLGLNGSKFGNSRDRLVEGGKVIREDRTYFALSQDI